MTVPNTHAFPFTSHLHGEPAVNAGMTLRDYFAAAAIPEAMRLVAQSREALIPGEDPEGAVARLAYEVADAMLARRAGVPPPKP